MDIKITSNTKNESPVQAFIDNIQAKQEAAQNKSVKEPKTLKISDEVSFTLPEPKSKEEIKVEQLLLKLSSGKGLSPGEIQYISANAPDKMQLVTRAIAEQKQLEAMMKAAKSKAEASMAAATVMQVAVNSTDVPQEAAGKINMIRGVFNEYAKSADFKSKPDSLADEYNPELDEAIRKASEMIKENIENTENETDTPVEDTASAEEIVLPPVFENKDTKTEKSYEDKEKEEKLKRYKKSQFSNEIDINIQI